MLATVIFSLFVGIGATLALDAYAALSRRVIGRGGSDWGLVGRWLAGLARGQWVLRDGETASTGREQAIGWTFHYLVGIAYAAMLPIFWGPRYILSPSLTPAIYVGLIVSSGAGAMILMPAMGAGFLGRKLPEQAAALRYMAGAHGIFALALYGLALLVSQTL